MAKNKNLLLTGGTGFLGSNLLRRFVAEGYRIVLLTRASSDTWRIKDCMGSVRHCMLPETCLDALFQEESFDSVVHCATNYGRREVDITCILEANLILPLQLLQLARKYKVGSFINTDTILDKRVSSYSLSKSQFREWLELFSEDICCVNVALEHFYGPLDDPSKFVTFVIQSLLNGIDTLSLTMGEQKRDFIFIDDVVNAFIHIIQMCGHLPKRYSCFEIGSGQNIRIREFVQLVKRLTNNNQTYLDFGAIPYRDNEVMESHVNLEGISALGWSPSVSLEEGLTRTVAAEKEGLNR